jgi:hypothetical protein
MSTKSKNNKKVLTYADPATDVTGYRKRETTSVNAKKHQNTMNFVTMIHFLMVHPFLYEQ